ncbi:MAG: hypothetical protein KAT61_05735, partial [Gammaproteobacteria bacterium]|nr:hypothetical protein [Gammaproteobacteria bacterium]
MSNGITHITTRYLQLFCWGSCFTPTYGLTIKQIINKKTTEQSLAINSRPLAEYANSEFLANNVQSKTLNRR